ncbi:hypothetical protein NHX12_001000 [Muraenolepis orangiensis]|uniref:DH domain-containing protein n=1 Tax=Muraenolepis orangiensis TaxID=630683 RepID=A0A9Q0IEJ3_9TELE|nr:hypothetical protein NHX12_001000 [Muraenolepis orangiensis]
MVEFRCRQNNPTPLLGALFWCICVQTVRSGYVPPPCLSGDYLTDNGTCCNKCPPGFKLVADCVAYGKRTSCSPCPSGQYMEHLNYTPNCRNCNRCKEFEEEVSNCKSTHNTICRCKNGFYKAVINSDIFQCLSCLTCPPGKRQSEKFLLLVVGIVTYLVTKRHTKSKMGKGASTPAESVPGETIKILLHSEELSYEGDNMAKPCVWVCEQELCKLPDCIPLEINIPGLIYSVLELVPATRVKELSRGLSVKDVEIERAEMDHRTCKEAHYQMLRAWAERESRGGGVGRGGGVLHRPLMQELLDKLRDMHLGGAVEELETNGDGSGQAKDDAADRGGGGEWHKEPETAETVFEGFPSTAETLLVHWGPADAKHKYHTMGYNGRKTKQKVAGGSGFASVSKGSVAAKPRAALKQALFSQGVFDKTPTPEAYRLQVEALKLVLETFPVPDDLSGAWKEQNQGTTLEKHWTDIVDSHTTMSQIQKHQQEALWEFIYTELTYINKLFIIENLVIAALVNLHQHGFLQEITPKLLFSNLPSVLNAHCQFWQDVIHPMLQEVRKTGIPFDPRSLEVGCLEFRERFGSYLPYCWEEENAFEFARQQMDTNPQFLVYLQWVESHPQCDRMRLGDMQAKPHQRITKYPLLLKALLKNTLDPHIQQSIRGMLSSVNGFLETINDYLRFMDEGFALSISAQRIEGYEISGINEEIDKHVREICHFDLTRPVSGVGRHVVRQLLLEGNLKMRGRRDSKQEVVTLLFSDVLLMTKVQKKAEKLKVVRPPLALDNTCCVALKDGYSFLLVEVSELGCAMNIYIFATATTESCSTWVSTIQEAKNTLKTLRKAETRRQIVPHFDTNLGGKTMETIKEHVEQSADDTFVEQLSEEPIIVQSGNGLLKSSLLEPAVQPSSLPISTNPHSKSTYISRVPGKAQENESGEVIEIQVRKQREEVVVEFQGSNERKATWHHDKSSSSWPQNTDPLRSKPKEGQNVFLGMYPEVDYPTAEPASPPKDGPLSNSSKSLSVFPSLPVGGTKGPMKTGYNVQLVDHKIRHSLSMEGEAYLEAWRFSRRLKSPRLRRRRPNNNHQVEAAHGQVPGGSETVWTTPHANSSSDSDSNQKVQGRFDQKHNSNGTSPRVLKLSSLKTSPEFFWNMYETRVSPELEIFSEPELSQELPGRKKALKAQRRASIPDIHKNATGTVPGIDNQRPPRFMRHSRMSPVEGLLERAKVRVREGGKGGRNEKMQDTGTWRGPSPAFYAETLSLTPSDGDPREVELTRHRVPTVSQGWREQLVDGDAEDKKYSHIFVNESTVDWSGWCFDDEEVRDSLEQTDHSTGHTGMLEDIDKTLTTRNIIGLTDTKISQV